MQHDCLFSGQINLGGVCFLHPNPQKTHRLFPSNPREDRSCLSKVLFLPHKKPSPQPDKKPAQANSDTILAVVCKFYLAGAKERRELESNIW